MKKQNLSQKKLSALGIVSTCVFLLGMTSATIAGTNTQKSDIHEKSVSVHSTADFQSLINDVLRNTESSLQTVESNTWDSLQHVENAIQSIREIKENLSPDTHVEEKSPLVINESKEYWFKYPSVDKETLYNEEIFPTLHSKYKSGIFYQGEGEKSDGFSAYFDYAFAYASLKTARDALSVEKFKEANIALKWVFEAVYLRPDFYVSDQNIVDLNDKLLNMKGEYPKVAEHVQ